MRNTHLLADAYIHTYISAWHSLIDTCIRIKFIRIKIYGEVLEIYLQKLRIFFYNF